MNPRLVVLSLSALLTLSAVTVYAQGGDIGPLPGADFPVEDQANEKHELLDGPHAIYARPEFETNWKDGVHFKSPGDSEKVDLTSIEVLEGRDSVQLRFFTQSRNEILIPFFKSRSEKAQSIAERMHAGESIDLSSCIVKEKQGEPIWEGHGGSIRCRRDQFKRKIKCSKTDFTPTTRGYVAGFFTQTSKDRFESVLKSETDYLNCYSTDVMRRKP